MSKCFVFCLSCCILIIIFLPFKYDLKYIHSKQQKDKLGTQLKSNSNQNKGPQKQDLRQWMNEKEKNYQKDKERIQRVCKKYNVKHSKLIGRNLIHVDRNHRIGFCNHAKVGSSTWRYHMRDLLPPKIFKKLAKKYKLAAEDNPLKWLRAMNTYYSIPKNTVSGGSSYKKSPYSINNFLRSHQILSFSFVRHPFERLVSAYNDKFVNTRGKYFKAFEWWFGKQVSFSSFADLVLYQYRTRCYPNNTPTSRISTNLADENCEHKIDTHWRPFAFKCSYCDINYDLIGRKETWNDDIDYIIRKRGLEKVLPLQKAHIAHHASKEYMHQSTEEMAKEYFNTLSQKQKEDLYHMFRLDFEMFNYDPKIYF